MSRPERQQNVLDLLEGLRGIEPLKQLKHLFWTELNYQRVNQPLSRRGWTESASKALADDPVLFAGGGEDNAFHVIYCRLASNALARGLERPVVTQLLREHPYALFVFSNKGQTDWHFLNVKYDDQTERRRLFRRITVKPGAGLRTATERVQLLDLAEIHPELFGITPLAIQQRCDAAFDVEAVTKDFFSEVANWYFWALKNASFPKNAPKEKDGHDHISIIRLITRLIFCWFVKEKGLIPDTLFDQQKLAQILTGFDPAKVSATQSVFYKAILQNLFFATLNTEMDKRAWRKDDSNFMAHILYRHRALFQKPNEALDYFKNIPFLNGGLFECLDKREGTPEKPKDIRIDGFSDRSDSQPTVPDFLFFGGEREVDLSEDYGDKKFKRVPVRGLIHIFNRYNFTVEENTPIEQEVALDPELSGKVFENLLAAYNPETGATARKQTGSFYTPREIVNYMVDESLIACLKTKLEVALPSAKNVEARLRQLFAYTDEPHQFTVSEVDAIIVIVDSLKTLDPAVGSGAFPMGILHKLVFILGKLDPHNEKWKERQIQRVRNTIKEAEKTEDAPRRDKMVSDLEEQITGINEAFELNELDYGRKLYLIENCIYGVDIQPIAVQIAKMRFFISLIVDQKIDDAKTNRGVLPLPNLETKFVAANTLIGIERPDTQGKLFSNEKVEKLKSDLFGIRHRMFTAKSPSTKQTLREKDKKVRQALAGEIQKSLVKANEDEICKTRLELEKARKTSEEEQSKPVKWETTRLTNLFGETEETRIDPAKDKKLRLKEQVKQLESKLLRANQRDADIDTTARRLSNWDPYDQNASADFFDPEWMFGLLDGFDLTFGNPPYLIVKEANTDKTLLAHYAGYQTADFKINLFALFLERAIVLGSKLSIHSYIIPDPALNLPAFRKLREHILDNTALSVISYYHEDIFHSASVGKSVILLYIKGCSAESFVFREFQTLYSKKEAIIPFQQVREDSDLKLSYSFSAGGEVILLQKLKKSPIKLARYCDIYDGINPGSVEIKDTLISNHYIDSFSKKIIDGKDFTKFAPVHWDGSYIYYSETFVDQLKRKIQKSGRDFTARIIKKTNFFEREKIVSRQTAESIIATFDNQKYFVKNSVHSSLLRSEFVGKISLLSIVALMNSRVIDWFYRKESMEGGRLFPQVKIGRLENLPFPAVELLIKENNYLTDLVAKIMAEKKRNLTADITTLEQKIDRTVYDLYGLTPEEIKIVEDATA